MTLVAGLDGCRGGWVAVLIDGDTTSARAERIGLIGELFERTNTPQIVAVDMPIGLPERTGHGGRAPERLVRPNLGKRQSSVFSISSRSAVYLGVNEEIPESERYRLCCEKARATSDTRRAVAKQGYHIFPKIVEIDTILRTQDNLVTRVHECHPEVTFWAMNGKKPLDLSKKVRGQPHPPGMELRRRLLASKGFGASVLAPGKARELRVGEDDLLDACAASWTALRIANGQAMCFPDPPEHDAHGLPIAIRA